MGRALRSTELALGMLLSFAVVVAAQGWLYALRPHLAGLGPRIHDALPLDELPRHDSVSLLLFLCIWGAAGLLVGILARTARVERLTAALLAALATGGWLLATTWISILVVRQTAAPAAFRSALHVPALYLAAALVGLGAALLGRTAARPSQRAPVVLASLVAAIGVLNVFSAITPGLAHRLQLVEAATPSVLPRLASALIVPTGLALIVLARGLRRRRRRAWQLTLALVLAAVVLHILNGLDYEEAIASVLLAVALVACRHDFERGGDPGARGEFLLRASVYLLGIFAYGTVALWINRIAVDRPYTLAFALRETAESLAGLHPHGSEHLSGQFGDWFGLSVFLLGIAAMFSLLGSWLAPWRYRNSRRAQEEERAQELVTRFGVDTLAPFVLRSDKSYFFSQDEGAMLAYKVVAGVAVVSGDPIGEPGSVEQLWQGFSRFAHERDWRIAVLGAGTSYLELYRRHGLRAIYHGDEGVIDVSSFSLEGRPIRKVRQSVHRLQRAGYTAVCVYARELGAELRAELEQVAHEWRGSEPQRGFTMEFESLFSVGGDNALFVVGGDEHGRIGGFFHLAVSPAGRALSLSSMPRRPNTPNGFNEWLVAETVEWAKRNGFERVSMNFAPFAAVMAPNGEVSASKRLQRAVLVRLKGTFQLDNLLTFNRKFFPTWERRYVVFERLADLPRVGLAGLAAEGYLPLVGQRR
ncbi:MAG TPA: phosphatidylglycerol lysyltransferase domain-containing protein [Gaiellaceae bacterium]